MRPCAARLRVSLPPRDTRLVGAARWAAVTFVRACQYAVRRDLPGNEVTRVLSLPCPGKRGPGVPYSVDLTFRLLPALCLLGRSTAEKDALGDCLLTLARH